MILPTRKFILTAVSTLAVLLLCPVMRANSTITLNVNGYSTYANASGIGNVGPYSATVTDGSNTYNNVLVFCLDANLAYSSTYSNTGPAGYGSWTSLSTLISQTTTAGPQTPLLTQQEEEAAFLASYALYLGAQATGNSSTIVNTVDGPIQMAIWQIMNTLGQFTNPYTLVTRGPFSTDPNAQLYVTEAQQAWKDGYITSPSNSGFLNSVYVWAPSDPNSTQRFVSVFSDSTMIHNAVPEPGTMIFMGTGVLLLALSRIRRQ